MEVVRCCFPGAVNLYDQLLKDLLKLREDSAKFQTF